MVLKRRVDTMPKIRVKLFANFREFTKTKELEMEDSIIDAFIGFKVEHNWLAENNLEESSIKLLRWDGSKWNSLETVPTSRDETFVYYESKTRAFSPFAIVAIPIYPSPTIQVVEIETPLQKIVELIGGPKLSRWLYIIIALMLGGLLAYSLINIQRGIRIYDNAEKIKPQDEDTWYGKAFALHEQGKYIEAIQAYDKAIELEPEDAHIWYNKGFALYELGKYEEAIKAYDKSRKIIRRNRH